MATTTTQDWAPHDPLPRPLSQPPLPTTTRPISKTFATGWQIPMHQPDPPQDLRIPRSTLEKIYLNPPTDVKGEFRNTFANPTPLGLVGFLVATVPMSLSLMGLHGGDGGGGGQATVAFGLFFGGVLQILSCLMEWILGNTFSFLVFGSFGAAWTALSCSNLPAFDAMGSYLVDAKTAEEVARGKAAFSADFAFGLATFALLVLTFALCSLRTNLVFFITFLLATAAISLLAGSYWALALEAAHTAAEMQRTTGVILFTCCVLAWYLLVANLLEVLEFGWELPVGDLSGRFGGGKREGKREWRDRSRSV
ncbi:unnamed protein product [Zymoseptoria tritici ST99CH_3D1]|nr:unnamed protein product [Zymoseptoria tritici ST99CH_3D1]